MPKRRIGYAFWGFMADVRMQYGRPFSAPDGNYLHSWAILHGFQDAGWETIRLFPDRDAEYVQLNGANAFKAFSRNDRWRAYARSMQAHHIITPKMIRCDWPEIDVVLLEWRMPTPKNTLPLEHPDFNPDLVLQQRLIEHYTSKGVPILCLDMDCLMNPAIDDALFHHVFELGWRRGAEHHIETPFYMDSMKQFAMGAHAKEIVYVGNRYDRDPSFEQFFGHGGHGFQYHVYGNWLEGGKDSQTRWPHIQFHPRAQPYEIRDAYKMAAAVPLLMKDTYAQYGFMTGRLLEVLLFGSIPFLPITFRSPLTYVPDAFRIYDEADMCALADFLASETVRAYIRNEMIDALEFCDIAHFIRKIMHVL